MVNKSSFSIFISDLIWNTYYDIINSIFYGKKYTSKSPKPKISTYNFLILFLEILGWLIMTIAVPMCGIVLAYSVSPSRIDIIPAIFEKDYLVISNPLFRTNSESQDVIFTASFSFLFNVKYVNRLFIDKIIIENVEIAYLGKIPFESSNNSYSCNSDNMNYLFPNFAEQIYTKIPMEMVHFSCTDDYNNCIVGITINSEFKMNTYNENSYKHDLNAGYSNFVIRTYFSSSQLMTSLVSGRLGHRYTPFSIPIKT